ncbi:hypothetical protein [Hymenobacter rubidus]|uniref:hypothetical protein n=1 Tax=Hymenobacter rubidus TaxID=1441626 RepID=UPI00191CF8F4|nr:hypothetical protein [Hymenobacter rubidus]
MVRTFLTLALSMFLLAEASAQTQPAAVKKTTVKSTKASARVAARKAKKARRVAIKSAPAAPLANDGWPAIDETQTAVASTTTGGWDATPAASSRGEIDNQNVYAAPGMPIHMRTGNGLVPYSVRPPRKPATTQTTLGN